MTRITGGWAVLAVVAAGALAGGCGDEDEGPSKSEYLKRANAICKRFNMQVERQAQRAFAGIEDESQLTAARARGFFEEALPTYQKQIAGLRALDPPEGDEEAVKRIYDAGDAEGRRIRGSLADGSEVRRLVTADSVRPRFERLSKDYGLEACAQR